MQYKPNWHLITVLFLISISSYACVSPELETASLNRPSSYKFPETIDPSNRYMFYLHGKIIEDQGIPAISSEYGEYEFDAILEELSSYGFTIIGDVRVKNTDPLEYAKKVTEQVNILLDAGVPPGNISVVGASKGAGIAIYVSNLLKNKEVNFVLLAICHPDQVNFFIQEGISLEGNVLSIYDSNDRFAGTCQELFSSSEGNGVGRFDEIVLEIGTGHGILYQPIDDWILPTVQWAEQNAQ